MKFAPGRVRMSAKELQATREFFIELLDGTAFTIDLGVGAETMRGRPIDLNNLNAHCLDLCPGLLNVAWAIYDVTGSQWVLARNALKYDNWTLPEVPKITLDHLVELKLLIFREGVYQYVSADFSESLLEFRKARRLPALFPMYYRKLYPEYS